MDNLNIMEHIEKHVCIPWADYRPCSPWFSYTLVYGMYHSEKMTANYVGALRSHGPLKYVTTLKSVIFCIFITKTSMHLVI